MKVSLLLRMLLLLSVVMLVLPGVALAQDPTADPYGDDGYYYPDDGYYYPDDGSYYDNYGDYGSYGDTSTDFSADMPMDEYQSNFSENVDAMRGQDGENVAARYRVNQGQISLETPQDLSQADRDQHAQIWALVTGLIPARWINNYFTEYELFAGGDTLAYVTQDQNDPSKWVIGVNTAEASNRGLLAGTLIHEFGHVVMLNDMQLAPPGGACATYNITEGCANPNSFINGFYNQFWTNIQLDANGDAVAGTYDANPSAFVSDYAATNPVEDGAETFLHFVITANQPSGGTIADQKVAFFYNFPQLVQLRQALRANLSTLMINNAQ